MFEGATDIFSVTEVPYGVNCLRDSILHGESHKSFVVLQFNMSACVFDGAAARGPPAERGTFAKGTSFRRRIFLLGIMQLSEMRVTTKGTSVFRRMQS